MFMKRRSEVRQCSTLIFYIVISLGAAVVVGVTDFKPNLQSTVLKQEGKHAEFPWDYTVDNKLLEFDSLSPRWSFYNSSGFEFRIGQENRFKSWAWEVTNETCPPRLLYPEVRVNKTSVATLVINNVTIADAGIYGCTLVLSSPKTSKMELIVSVTPQINLVETKHIVEHDNLTVNCSAIGPPTPSVMWIRDGNKLAFGVNGSAVLKIYDITRDQSGKYNCSAKNNPEEKSVEKEINIIVEYPVVFIDSEKFSTKSVKAYLGEKNVNLKTVADGVPTPTHFWFLPNKTMVKSETSRESTYTIPVVMEEDIGNWTINITNWIHSFFYVHTIEVVRVAAPTPEPEYCLSTGKIVGIVIGVLVGVGIIAVIVVVIYKKVKKDDKRISLKALVLIIIGVLVASGIIVAIIVAILDECIKAGLLVGITFGVLVGVGIIAVIVVVIYVIKKKG